LKKILAIDYGERHIGIAISDEHHTFAFPLFTIDTRKQPDYIQKIAGVVMKEEIGKILIGLPTSPEGGETGKAKKVRRFADQLSEYVSVPIMFWDEAYTTQKAQSVLHLQGQSLKKHKEKLDMIAATILLEDFLQANPDE
jgi:putative Holliday junction resolvase